MARPAPNPSFGGFWALALLSNSATAASWIAINWQLGNTALPEWVPVLSQSGSAVAGILGATSGFYLQKRLGATRLLRHTSAAQAAATGAAACLWVVIGSSTPAVEITILLLLTIVIAGIGGVGGPSWIAMVTRWPGSTEARGELLARDSGQYQLARALGPLAGGAAVLVLGEQSVAVLCALDCVTFLGVSRYFARMPPVELIERPATPVGRRSSRRHFTTALALLFLVGFGFDGARAYLSRVSQSIGIDAAGFSLTVAAIGVGATIAGLVPRRSPSSSSAPSPRSSLALLVAALLAWGTTAAIAHQHLLLLQVVLLIVGGLMGGAGIGSAFATLTTAHMRTVGDARGSVDVTIARTVAGSIGAGTIAASLYLGTNPFLPCLITVGGAFIWALASRPPSDTGSEHPFSPRPAERR